MTASETSPGGERTRCVILLHTHSGAGGGAGAWDQADWHFDWMLARDGGESGEGAGPLLTFRTQARPDQIVEPFEAERLPDHRAAYLTYQGPISGGRGEVRRVAELLCRIHRHTPERILVELWVGGQRILWSGAATATPSDGPPRPWELWRFEPVQAP